MTNRFTHGQPDYLFLIVRTPKGWRPKNYFDVPVNYEILSTTFVASYAEAHDDLKRCNRHALQNSIGQWAIVQAVEAEL